MTAIEVSNCFISGLLTGIIGTVTVFGSLSVVLWFARAVRSRLAG